MISVLVLLGLLENCVVFIFFLEIFAKFGYSFFVIMLNVVYLDVYKTGIESRQKYNIAVRYLYDNASKALFRSKIN